MNGKITSLTTQSESPLIIKGVFTLVLILVVVAVVMAVNGGQGGQVSQAVASFIESVG